jgi:hypothetical protein
MWLCAVPALLAGIAWTPAQSQENAGTAQMPRQVLPPPTPEQLARPPAAPALAMEIREARLKMGWPAFLVDRKFGGLERQKIAIIDSGFRGLAAWLKDHPDEAKLTTYVSDPGLAQEDARHHGYDVYRVARLVLGDATLLLYKTRTMGNVLEALADAAQKGATIANVSLGPREAIDVVLDDSGIVRRLDQLLRRNEIFTFFAVGNARDETHSWVSADRNGNGYVDIRSSAAGASEMLSVRLPAGEIGVFLGWDAERRRDGAGIPLGPRSTRRHPRQAPGRPGERRLHAAGDGQCRYA